MSSPPVTLSRAELLQLLEELVQRNSTWTVLLHAAIAERIGLNATDHKCLDVLRQTGPVTAGQLAEITGLTTGAITGVVDRLERAGYARRVPDRRDRRRVIIEPDLAAAVRDLGPLFEPMGHDWQAWIAGYSDEQLAFVVEFLTRGIEFAQRHITRLRQTTPSESPGPTGLTAR